VGGSWTATNIGDAATTGNLAMGNTTASLTGSGMGFQEISDSIRFAWKPLTGDGSVTARVTGFSANNGGKAFGGLMLRSSLRRESANVAATVVSGGGVRFTRRGEDGAYTEPTTHTLRAPHWVRVERVGNTFTGYRSEDGVNWVQQGAPATLAAMPANAVWGLAVTSHGGNAACRADFSHVTLEPLGGQGAPSNTWSGADIGSPDVTGSNSGSGASFTVNGGGTDIWGASDQFRFLSQSLAGDARLTARVTAVDRTDPWAKAGVMVRASSAAAAANAFLAVTPLNGINWQVRETDGATTTGNNAGTAHFTAPHWLRLTRAGNTFTCHHSNDGISWQQLGLAETLANAPATMHAGFMIASINNNGNSVVNLDHLALVESGSNAALPAIAMAPGQNPAVANNFTLAASSTGSATWSWQKLSGPGNVTFRTQNTATPLGTSLPPPRAGSVATPQSA
jgi:regulation of enolase protein 1 (concanavalin A-like superfamily)